MEKDRQNRIPLFFLSVLLAYSTSLSVLSYYEIGYMDSAGLVGTLLLSLFLVLLWNIAVKTWKTLAVSAALIAGTVLLAWPMYKNAYMIEESFFPQIIAFFSNLFSFFVHWSRSILYPELFRFWTVFAVVALFSLLMVLFLLKWRSIYVVFLVTVSIIVSQWVASREVVLFSFYITLVCLFLLYIHDTGIVFQKIQKDTGKRINFSELSLFVIPILTVLLIVIMLVPKSDLPIQWPWLDNKVNEWNRRMGFYDYERYEYFTYQMTAYRGDSGTLGGEITPSRIHLLDVYAPGNVYLRGASWNAYTGTSWKNDQVLPEESYVLSKNAGQLNLDLFLDNQIIMELHRFLEYREHPDPEDAYEQAVYYKEMKDIINLDYHPGDILSSETPLFPWYTVDTIGIHYRGLETKTIFSPLYGLIQDASPDLFIDAAHIINSDVMIRRSTRFDIRYLNINTRGHDFITLLKDSRQDLYFDLYQKLYELGTKDVFVTYSMRQEVVKIQRLLEQVKQEELLANSLYTGLPDTLPARVRDLSREITRLQVSDYDKVKAIEDFLKQNYLYTLSPDDTPEGRDFVDYFLFDIKNGYCTYYATAMAVLVRGIGLPARYVEGFVLPFSPVAFGQYQVTGKQAHAWTEVYFEGVGWVPFEPTPPFSSLLDLRSNLVDLDPDDMMDDDFDDYFEDYYSGFFPRTDTGPIFILPEDSEEKPSAGNILLILFGSAFILILSVNLTIFAVRSFRFKKVRNKESFRRNYLILFRMFNAMGYTYTKNQTLLRYAKGIDKVFSFKNVEFSEITMIYYKILYGDQEIDSTDIEKWSIFVKEFSPLIREIMGFWQIIWNRILFPRF
ncbi:MAG: transglutaminase domain-containing protein [Clostridia bacterium]